MINAVALGIAIADAADEIRAAADHTTKSKDGKGAFREAVEMTLQ